MEKLANKPCARSVHHEVEEQLSEVEAEHSREVEEHSDERHHHELIQSRVQLRSNGLLFRGEQITLTEHDISIIVRAVLDVLPDLQNNGAST